MNTKFSILLEYDCDADLYSPGKEEIKQWIEHLIPKKVDLKVKEVVQHSENQYEDSAVIHFP